MTQRQDNPHPSAEAVSTDLGATQIVDALRALEQTTSDSTLDLDQAERLTHALFEHFRNAPEAAAFDNPLEGPDMLARLSGTLLGVTITALDGRQLDAVLFEHIPAKMSIGADAAHDIVQSSRALFVWLKRECALEHANELIELLGDDAARELEQRMDDPANFGPGKAMIMEAMAAGIDLSSKEAIDDFMASRMRGGLDDAPYDPYGGFDSYPATPAPTLTPEQQRTRQKKRKKDRKAARKARKKNR